MDAASVKAHNGKVIGFIRGLEKQHIKDNPGSKFRYSCLRAIRSVTNATECIRSGKDAMKLEGIGAFIGSKIEAFLEQQGLATAQTNENVNTSVGGGEDFDDDDTCGALKAGFDDLYLSQLSQSSSSSSKAASTSKSSSSSSSSSSSRRKEQRAPAKAKDYSPPRQPLTSILSADDEDDNDVVIIENSSPPTPTHTAVMMEITPRKGPALSSTSSSHGRGGKEDGDAVVVISDDSDDNDAAATSKTKAKAIDSQRPPNVGRKRKVPSTPIMPAFHASATSSSSKKDDDDEDDLLLLDPLNSHTAAAAAPPPSLQARFDLESKPTTTAPPPPAVAAPPKAQDFIHLLDYFSKTDDEYHVVLLLDQREHDNNDQVQSLLLQEGVICEVRSLSLCDMLWVVRKNQRSHGGLLSGTASTSSFSSSSSSSNAATAAGGGRGRHLKGKSSRRGGMEEEEIMLRYCIERKTSGDLARSIIDGRYTEQKSRMLGAGNEVDRAFYVIEGSLSRQDTLSVNALRTAMSTTLVHHGISVVITESLDQTIQLLRRMHTQISQAFASFQATARIMLLRGGSTTKEEWTYDRSCPLPCRIIPFKEYQDICRKGQDLDIRALFGRQLRQIPGFSAAKTEAVLQLFPTSISLVKTLNGMTEEEAVAMLQAIPIQGQERTLGARLASFAYELYK